MKENGNHKCGWTIFSWRLHISLIIRSSLMRGMVSSGLMNRYSLEKMLLELEKLHVVEDANGGLSELVRTRKQKDILEALEKV